MNVQLVQMDKPLPQEVSSVMSEHERYGRNLLIRMHPASIAWPVLLAAVGLVIVIALGAASGSSKVFVILLIAWSYLGFRALYKFASWAVDYFIVLPTRVMLITGLFNRKVAMMPLNKITDMTYNKPFLGRILGYGEFEIESAGQDQALRNVPFLPYPDQTYQYMIEVLYPGGKSDD